MALKSKESIEGLLFLLNNNLICNLLICSVDVNFDTIYTIR